MINTYTGKQVLPIIVTVNLLPAPMNCSFVSSAFAKHRSAEGRFAQKLVVSARPRITGE